MPQPRFGCHTGLDALVRDGFAPLRGRRIALLCNQAAIAFDLRHSLDLFLDARDGGLLNIAAVFGPQHGLWGHTQDNMVEWEGGRDPRTGLPVFSLYGEHRKPTPETLRGLETFVVDVPDVGARAYTFIWTVALCLEACAGAGVPVMVLDRPNPLGGVRVEGPVLEPEYASFIGLHPLPMRHGMTVGEVARHLQRLYYPSLALEVVEIEGWDRSLYGDETGLPWAAPSPNMPSVETAVVFPGMCLLEGTSLSEGRGTTRPFETFGAPWTDAWELSAALNALDLPGARFRPLPFEPTFDKHAGRLCGGAFLHVLDRNAFEPVLTGIAVLQTVRRLYPKDFAWRPPPFEYEAEKMPIDILAGTDRVRKAVEEDWPLDVVRAEITTETPRHGD